MSMRSRIALSRARSDIFAHADQRPWRIRYYSRHGSCCGRSPFRRSTVPVQCIEAAEARIWRERASAFALGTIRIHFIQTGHGGRSRPNRGPPHATRIGWRRSDPDTFDVAFILDTSTSRAGMSARPLAALTHARELAPNSADTLACSRTPTSAVTTSEARSAADQAIALDPMTRCFRACCFARTSRASRKRRFHSTGIRRARCAESHGAFRFAVHVARPPTRGAAASPISEDDVGGNGRRSADVSRSRMRVRRARSGLGTLTPSFSESRRSEFLSRSLAVISRCSAIVMQPSTRCRRRAFWPGALPSFWRAQDALATLAIILVPALLRRRPRAVGAPWRVQRTITRAIRFASRAPPRSSRPRRPSGCPGLPTSARAPREYFADGMTEDIIAPLSRIAT